MGYINEDDVEPHFKEVFADEKTIFNVICTGDCFHHGRK
jgi:hypothetical protein